MVAEHAPHHTLVFHGVGACSRARWTARPLRRTGRHCKTCLDDLTPWIEPGRPAAPRVNRGLLYRMLGSGE